MIRVGCEVLHAMHGLNELCIFQERNVNVIGVEERYVMNENDLNAVLKEGEGKKQYYIQC